MKKTTNTLNNERLEKWFPKSPIEEFVASMQRAEDCRLKFEIVTKGTLKITNEGGYSWFETYKTIQEEKELVCGFNNMIFPNENIFTR